MCGLSCTCRDTGAVAQARADFAKWHAADLQHGSCVVVRYPDRDKELVLVPVRIKTGVPALLPTCVEPTVNVMVVASNWC